jgi:hypothetical protein
MQPQSYRRMVHTLCEFESWRCLWRLPVSVALFAAVPLFLIGVAVAAGAVAGDDFDLKTGIAAAVLGVGGSTYLYPRLARRQFHRKLIADRLWTWEKPNPSTHVRILLRENDVDEAKRVLRRAGFNPGIFMTHLASDVLDAPDLNIQVGIDEPEARPQSSSDKERVDRIAGALNASGIRARVAGIDVPRSITE